MVLAQADVWRDGGHWQPAATARLLQKTRSEPSGGKSICERPSTICVSSDVDWHRVDAIRIRISILMAIQIRIWIRIDVKMMQIHLRVSHQGVTVLSIFYSIFKFSGKGINTCTIYICLRLISIRIRIRQNDADPTRSWSGSTTLVLTPNFSFK